MNQIFFNFFQFILQPGFWFPQVTEELAHPPHRRVAMETGEAGVKILGNPQRHVGGSVGETVDNRQLDYQVVSILLLSLNMVRFISAQVNKKNINIEKSIYEFILIFHLKLSCSVVKYLTTN